MSVFALGWDMVRGHRGRIVSKEYASFPVVEKTVQDQISVFFGGVLIVVFVKQPLCPPP